MYIKTDLYTCILMMNDHDLWHFFNFTNLTSSVPGCPPKELGVHHPRVQRIADHAEALGAAATVQLVGEEQVGQFGLTVGAPGSVPRRSNGCVSYSIPMYININIIYVYIYNYIRLCIYTPQNGCAARGLSCDQLFRVYLGFVYGLFRVCLRFI